MICPVCGRTTENENANFCENCGTSFRVTNNQNTSFSPVDTVTTESVKPKQEEIPFRTFLGVMLLPMVPMIGPLIYIVILLTWSFGKQYSGTQKNYARATLVVLLFSILFITYAISSGILSMPI